MFGLSHSIHAKSPLFTYINGKFLDMLELKVGKQYIYRWMTEVPALRGDRLLGPGGLGNGHGRNGHQEDTLGLEGRSVDVCIKNHGKM